MSTIERISLLVTGLQAGSVRNPASSGDLAYFAEHDHRAVKARTAGLGTSLRQFR